MEFAIPTSSVGTLKGVLTRLETDVTKMKQAPAVETKQYVVARLTAGVAAFICALADELIHASLVVLKALPVAYNITLGKLTGYALKSPGLQGQDWVGHLEKMRDTFIVAVNALLVTLFLEAPDTILAVAKKVNILPKNPDEPDTKVVAKATSSDVAAVSGA